MVKLPSEVMVLPLPSIHLSMFITPVFDGTCATPFVHLAKIIRAQEPEIGRTPLCIIRFLKPLAPSSPPANVRTTED